MTRRVTISLLSLDGPRDRDVDIPEDASPAQRDELIHQARAELMEDTVDWALRCHCDDPDSCDLDHDEPDD